MTKKRNTILLTISIFLVVVFIAITTFIHVTNERYINTQGSYLTTAYEEIERLEQDLAEEREQLMVSNWKLQMIDARNEGIKYQEGLGVE